MAATERLQQLKQRFQFYRYPELLVNAIYNYLAEEGGGTRVAGDHHSKAARLP
jgi:hypothetical protein